ncbi:hypothetical protein G7Y89_g6792 [Cudoniella acicularis]|uniref:Uncharacterized protein n=1 Tax=Cudoniella acicularis TaxID=354080 RepID=A0A8H4W2I8_9HELO|nr:hypothetical protein G7Y89_g6792 [Cudoniella acicularis]
MVLPLARRDSVERSNSSPTGRKPYLLRLSRVPNVLAFIIYRVLPIGSLSTIVYEIYKRYGVFGCIPYWILTTPAVIGICMGIWSVGRFEFKYTVEEAQFREAWADMLRMKIEDYEANSPKYPFGFRKPRTPERARKEIQCQKERVATYLAGSRQGIPPLISRREGFYLRTIYFTVALGGLRLICRNIPDGLQSNLHDFFTRQPSPFSSLLAAV